jgi:hypothetical protein
MIVQPGRLGRAIGGGVLFLSLAASPALFATSALAQTAIVSANAPTNPHDAAVAAAAKGDYIGALALAKQAAAAGQPLEADQIDFMTGKAAKQQAALDDAAKTKAKQQEASATAQEIEARQQKEYAARNKVAKADCPKAPKGRIEGIFTSAAADATASKSGSGSYGPKITGDDCS